MCQHSDVRFDALFAIADVHADDRHAGLAQALELRQKAFVARIERHARMVVPHDRSSKEVVDA
jgi:hypothetical protein